MFEARLDRGAEARAIAPGRHPAVAGRRPRTSSRAATRCQTAGCRSRERSSDAGLHQADRRHDKITIDGTDVSNSFREFGFSSEHSEDVTGFCATGNDESLPGVTTQGFTGRRSTPRSSPRSCSRSTRTGHRA